MATDTKPEKTEVAQRDKRETLPAIRPPRLPYHPGLQERFGIDQTSWKALCEVIFLGATTPEAVILALSYCRARKLDPFKRNVHIVPVWNSQMRCMVDTIWPGIGELRTTAFRTGEYAGRAATEYGPDITKSVGGCELTYPEWAQVSVYRMVRGERMEFAGPRVYWVETYATDKRDSDAPNTMWRDRPRGQLEKCAEAAALRAAFPEEIGGDLTNDEAERLNRGGVALTAIDGPKKESLNDLAQRITNESHAALNAVDVTADPVETEPAPVESPVSTQEQAEDGAALQPEVELTEIDYAITMAGKRSDLTAISNKWLSAKSPLTPEQKTLVQQWISEKENELAAGK